MTSLRFCLFLLVLYLLVSSYTDAPMQHFGSEAGTFAYVSTNTCASCHEQEYQQWQQSHHKHAMSVANATSVLGDFNNAEFTKDGVRTRFYKKNGRYYVSTQGGDGNYQEYEIAYTFGHVPLQQYLVKMDGGRLQTLTVAWDTEKKAWYSLYPDEKTPPGDPLHWGSRHFTWNTMCADCHSTNLQKNYDINTDSFATSFASVNVDCQACHGPGDKHVKWAEDANLPDNGLVVDLRNTTAEQQLAQCGRCHSRRSPVSDSFNHGDSLLDHYVPARLSQGLYHADGQIDAEVFVYGSYAQSKMFQQGVKCTDCHNAHTGELKVKGNAVCLQCHHPQGNPRFPTLIKKDYTSKEHHQHSEDTAGAQCVNCHMPTQNYMVVDARRDHSIRIPRPDLSVALGVPNACTQCHTDQSDNWALESFEQWFDIEAGSKHYGMIFDRARRADPSVLAELSDIALDPDYSFIVRATALEYLQGYGQAGVEPTIESLNDKNAMIRLMAVSNTSQYSPRLRFAALTPLLNDPVRAVRMEVARAVADIPESAFDERELAQNKAALGEYLIGQMSQADSPEANINLGRYYWQTKQYSDAEQAYQRAIERDPTIVISYKQLAAVYQDQNKPEKALQVLNQGVEARPEAGDLQLSLGLLFAEIRQWDKSEAALTKAAVLSPNNSRIHYNLGLLLQKQKRLPEALDALQTAQSVDPNDPVILQAITMVYVENKQWSYALENAKKFRQQFPSHALADKLLEHVQGLTP